MAKRSGAGKLFAFVAWLTGIIVALAVGSALIGETLTVPFLNSVPYLMAGAGWVVIIATLIGVISAIVDAVK